MSYDKTELNKMVQDRYDELMRIGKHGHYETMFQVIYEVIASMPPKVVDYVSPDGYSVSRNHDGDGLLLRHGKVLCQISRLLKGTEYAE